MKRFTLDYCRSTAAFPLWNGLLRSKYTWKVCVYRARNRAMPYELGESLFESRPINALLILCTWSWFCQIICRWYSLVNIRDLKGGWGTVSKRFTRRIYKVRLEKAYCNTDNIRNRTVWHRRSGNKCINWPISLERVVCRLSSCHIREPLRYN